MGIPSPEVPRRVPPSMQERVSYEATNRAVMIPLGTKRGNTTCYWPKGGCRKIDVWLYLTEVARRPIGDGDSEFAPVGPWGGSCRATTRMRLDDIENPVSDGFPAL